MAQSLFDKLIQKIHCRSIIVLTAFILIISGIYLCTKNISQGGSINLKTTILEGNIETGSLGLLVIFLGAFIIIIISFTLSPGAKREEIELTKGKNKIIGKNLSYRKIKDILKFFQEGSEPTNKLEEKK